MFFHPEGADVQGAAVRAGERGCDGVKLAEWSAFDAFGLVKGKQAAKILQQPFGVGGMVASEGKEARFVRLGSGLKQVVGDLSWINEAVRREFHGCGAGWW
jgi:hypothetical protein